MVEPLEETRGEVIFATEPVLSSLELSIPGAGRRSPLVELDEVEVCTSRNLFKILCRRIMDPTDTERYIADLQGPLIPAFLCSANTHKYQSGNDYSQWCCQ